MKCLHVLLSLGLLTVPGLGATGAGGGSAPDGSPDLASLNLDELLSTPVTTVRRTEESLGRTAGAVYVITQKELRRSGVTSLPEALRLVPGLQVQRVGVSTWAISARGFNNVYANKLLVMIDGRTIYSPVVGGVFWDGQDTLLEDIDRIEVLRGPGAAMWGANAVNGVINVITKPAVRTQGTLVAMGTGTEDQGLAAIRFGSTAGRHGYFRVYAQEKLRVGAATADESLGDSRWSMTQGGFRGDWTLRESNSLTVQGDIYRSGSRSYISLKALTPPYKTVELDRAEAQGGNLNARWEHAHRDGGLSIVQGYFDSTLRDGALLRADALTGDLGYQYRRPAMRRHELSIGLGARVVGDETQISQFLNFERASQQYWMQHVTIQDDYSMAAGRVTLSGAARFEHNTFTGWTIQPTLRLLYAPDKKHAWWGAVSRSVRTPSRGELSRSLLVDVRQTPTLPVAAKVFASPDLGNEVGISVEAGYRGQIAKRLVVDGTAFSSRIEGLATPAAGNPVPQLGGPVRYILLPLRFRNQTDVNSQGAELAIRWKAASELELTSGLSWLHFSKIRTVQESPISPTDMFAASPGWQSYVGGEWIPARGWECNATWFWYGAYLSGMQTDEVYGRGLDAIGVAGTSRNRLDARVSRSLSDGIDLSAGAQALTAGNRFEYKSMPGNITAPVRPSAYVRISFRF